jgi:hypothetical protein
VAKVERQERKKEEEEGRKRKKEIAWGSFTSSFTQNIVLSSKCQGFREI